MRVFVIGGSPCFAGRIPSTPGGLCQLPPHKESQGQCQFHPPGQGTQLTVNREASEEIKILEPFKNSSFFQVLREIYHSLFFIVEFDLDAIVAFVNSSQ